MKFKTEKLHIYLISLIAFILPNIVFLKKVHQPLESFYYIAFPKGEYNWDFFSYYKVIFLLISTALLMLLFFLNKRKDLKWHKSYTFLLIYAFFIGASTISSPFLPLAVRGVGDRYEGVAVLFSYLLLFYVSHSSIENKEDIKIILKGIIGGSLVVGTIGIFQYFGFDLFRTNFGKNLILNSKDSLLMDKLNFTFGKYTIYSTLYNTNFVGSYMIMMFFLSIGMVLNNKCNKKYLIFSYLYSVFIFANLIGCRSRAGFLAAQATSLFALIFMFKYVRHYIKELSVLLVSFIFIFVLMDQYSKDYSNLSNKMFNLNTYKNTLRNIYSQDDNLIFETTDKVFKLNISENKINFLDEKNQKIKYTISKKLIKEPLDKKEKSRNIIEFQNKKYDDFVFIIEKNHFKMLYKDYIRFPIYYDNGKYKSIGIGSRLYEIENIDRVKFLDGREKMGSNRIYLWSRTIPLLKYTVFLGYGPDTFSILFPQNDNFGKTISFGTSNIIVDKPHNLYLQLGVNTGLISMFNFISACALFLIYGILIYKKNKIEKSIFSLSLYLGTIGYLVTGLFNDSLVSVAPIFWIYWALSLYLMENCKNN